MLSAGISVKNFSSYDFEEISDRSSVFYFCESKDERKRRLHYFPPGLLMIPIKDNTAYFDGVFAGSPDDVTGKLLEHHSKFDGARQNLLQLMSVHCAIMDPCSMLSSVLSFSGDKISSLMSERKKRSSAQFFVAVPSLFATEVFAPFLKIAGWSEVLCMKSDGRTAFRANSKYVFEHTVASPLNQDDSRDVTRKFVYLKQERRKGPGYNEDSKSVAPVSTSPYDMGKEELLAIMTANNLFEESEEYWQNAPLYELQHEVFDWLASKSHLFGVEFVYGVQEKDGWFCEIVIVPEKSGFGMARVVFLVHLAKFKVDFSVSEKKHVPMITMFNR